MEANKVENEEQKAVKAKRNPYLRALSAGCSLALVSALCMILIIKTDDVTRDLINYNQSEAKIMKVARSLMPDEVERSAQVKCTLLSDPRIGKDMHLYTFTKEEAVQGYLMTYSTTKGYASPLVLVGAFDSSRRLIKNDVLISNETPGLGDKVMRRNSSFMDMFNGKGPDDGIWDVKKFNGDFDFITGSTVTSRAVVLATKDALDTLRDSDLQALKECK